MGFRFKKIKTNGFTLNIYYSLISLYNSSKDNGGNHKKLSDNAF